MLDVREDHGPHSRLYVARLVAHRHLGDAWEVHQGDGDDVGGEDLEADLLLRDPLVDPSLPLCLQLPRKQQVQGWMRLGFV